jgi:hypothetical protein
MKQQVVKDLQVCLPLYTHFFNNAKRKPKYNPQKLSLREFVLDALLYIIQSFALTSSEEIIHVLPSVIQNNYSMSGEDAQEVVESMFAYRSNTKIILLAENKMRKHVECMLKTHSLQEVMEFYRRYLTPRFYEKKNLGQVFTPFPLIDKILDQIPLEIMSDPKSTFFDPSAGMGGFLVVLYKRLMITLLKAIPDKKKRHDHIVSNMLFGAELTKNNVHRMKKIFGNTFHVYEGNTLLLDSKEKMRKHFGVEQMRVIVGNPPFEKPQGKETRKVAGDTLWIDFVNMSLDKWLEKDGIFGMVLPPGWRKAMDEFSRSKDLWEKMSVQYKPLYIEMFDANTAKKAFHDVVSIRIDVVVLQKTKNQGYKTTILGTDGKQYKIDVTKLPFLPNGHLEDWKKVLTKNRKDGVHVLYSRSAYGSDKKSTKSVSDRKFKYKVIHAIHKDGSRVYLYTDKKNKEGGFGVSKLIFNRLGGWNRPVLDLCGEYGVSQNMFAVLFSSSQDAKDAYKFFSNPKMLTIFQDDFTWTTSIPASFWKMFRNMKNGFWHNIDF